MKKIIPLLIFILLLSGCGKKEIQVLTAPAPLVEAVDPYLDPSPTPEPSPEPTPTPTVKPVSPEVSALLVRNAEVWEEKQHRLYMAGRLLIPSAAIDVALFVGDGGTDEELTRQAVCDADDSAILFSDGIGRIIADHNNQSFATLSLVKAGDKAYILEGDCILSLICDTVTDGINTGHGITDNNGTWVTGNDDYICYTCGEDWEHILITGFMICDADYFAVYSGHESY